MGFELFINFVAIFEVFRIALVAVPAEAALGFLPSFVVFLAQNPHRAALLKQLSGFRMLGHQNHRIGSGAGNAEAALAVYPQFHGFSVFIHGLSILEQIVLGSAHRENQLASHNGDLIFFLLAALIHRDRPGKGVGLARDRMNGFIAERVAAYHMGIKPAIIHQRYGYIRAILILRRYPAEQIYAFPQHKL
ncbi:hypothetical protein SDC9_142141 [bioreactor metagenome]|uniref:Uncharacterized protein n=1 Tax=bioreactor metagenome TaxID=1076179 RepID=A0A645E352_9ZZZZ